MLEKGAIWVLIALFLTNQIAGNTIDFKMNVISIGYHMRGEVISVLSLERRYHILSRVSAANEGQNMIS